MNPNEDTSGLTLFILLIGLSAFGPMSTDLYLPSLPAIGTDFGVGSSEVQLTLSVFLAGFAVAMLIYGPMSDRFGRRPVVIGAICLYLVATVICVLAPTIEVLIAARFLQALGACAGPVVCRAIVRDIYGPRRAARMQAFIAMAMSLAPAIGPTIGGLLVVAFSWRANFVLLVVFGSVCLLGTLLVLKETNKNLNMEAMRPVQILRNFWSLVQRKRFRGYLLINTGAAAGLFSFISGSSYVLIDGMGLRPDHMGFSFGCIVLGYMLGSFLTGKLALKVDGDRLILIGATISSCGGVIMLFLALIDLRGIWGVVGIVGPAALFMCGFGLMVPNSVARAIAPFPRHAGTAGSLMGFANMGIGSLIGILVAAAYNGTALPMALSVAGGGLFCLFVILFVVRRAPEDGEAVDVG